MSKHRSPTNTELSQWEKYGSYAGRDAVQRMIIEIHKLRKVNDGLVGTVVDLRKALVKHGHHTPICPSYNEVDVECLCGLDAKLRG